MSRTMPERGNNEEGGLLNQRPLRPLIESSQLSENKDRVGDFVCAKR